MDNIGLNDFVVIVLIAVSLGSSVWRALRGSKKKAGGGRARAPARRPPAARQPIDGPGPVGGGGDDHSLGGEIRGFLKSLRELEQGPEPRDPRLPQRPQAPVSRPEVEPAAWSDLESQTVEPQPPTIRPTERPTRRPAVATTAPERSSEPILRGSTTSPENAAELSGNDVRWLTLAEIHNTEFTGTLRGVRFGDAMALREILGPPRAYQRWRPGGMGRGTGRGDS